MAVNCSDPFICTGGNLTYLLEHHKTFLAVIIALSDVLPNLDIFLNGLAPRPKLLTTYFTLHVPVQ